MDTFVGGRTYNGGDDFNRSQNIWIGDGDGIPGQTVGGIDAFRVSVEGPANQLADVFLTDSTGKALSGDGLPLGFNLSDWDGGRFTFLQGQTLVEGNIFGLRTVPDATSGVLLFAIGLMACAGARTVAESSVSRRLAKWKK